MPVPMQCTSCQKVMAVPEATHRRPKACPHCGGQLNELRPLRDTRYIVAPPKTGDAAPTATTVRTRRGPAATEAPPPLARVSDDYAQGLLVGLALLCGSMSVPLAAIALASPLAKPASGLGFVFAVAAWWRARQQEPPLGQGRPAAVAVLCFGLLMFVGSWNAYREWIPQPTPTTNPALRTVVAAGATGMAPARQVDADAWVDASAGMVQQNAVRVRLASAVVDLVKFKNPPADSVPRAKRLLLGLRLTSMNYTQPIAYETWADPVRAAGKHEPRLTDNLNRRYRRVMFAPGLELEGVSPSKVLTGGRPIDELLVFELPPLDQVLYLRLELPAAAIGATGSLRLQIPRYMIATKDE